MLALSFANDDSSFSVLGSNVPHVADFGSTTPMAFARYYAQNNSNIGYIMGVSNINDNAPIFTVGELCGTSAEPMSSTYISLANGNVGIGGVLQPSQKLEVAGSAIISGQLTINSSNMPFIIDSTAVVTNLNADMLDGQDGSFYRNLENINAGTLSVARGGTGLTSASQGSIIIGNGASGFIASSNVYWSTSNSELSVEGKLHVEGTSLLGPGPSQSGPFMRQKTWDTAGSSHTIAFADYALAENSTGVLTIQVSNKSNKLANIQISFIKLLGLAAAISLVSQHRTSNITTCSIAVDGANIAVSTDSDCCIAWTSIGAL